MEVQVVEYPFHPCHSCLQMEQGALLKEADVSSGSVLPKGSAIVMPVMVQAQDQIVQLQHELECSSVLLYD